MRGDVAEALDLLVLGGQVRDRVAQEVGEPERSAQVGGRQIADGHVDLGRTLLRSKLRDHGGRQLDPVHTNSSPAERQRDSTRADAELERRAGACQIRKEIHSWVEHRRIEQLRPESLVTLRYPFIEVGLRHAASMPRISL